MATEIDGIFTLTAPVVLSFPNLFTPRKFQGKGDPKYDAMFIFDMDHPDLPAIKALVTRIAEAHFPGVPLANLQRPWKMGEEVIAASNKASAAKGRKAADTEHLQGKLTITARSQFAPLLNAVVDGRLVKYRDDARPTAELKFYPGARVIVELNFSPHAVGSNTPGVTAYLNELVATGGGDRIAGGKPTEEKFSGYLGSMSQEDPTVGAAAATAW